MTPEELKKLIEKRDKIAAEMHAMHAAAEKDERAFNDEERGKWDAAKADLNGLDDRIKRSQELTSIEGTLEEIRNALPREEISRPEQDQPEERSAEQQYGDAFNAFLRSSESGLSGLSGEHRDLMLSHYERRAQGTTPDSAGGYTVPEGFGDRVVETLKDFGGILSEATELVTESGNDIPFPTMDDTTNVGEIIDENTQHNEQDATFGTEILKAYTYSSKIIRISIQLLQDNAVDIEGLLAKIIGQRIGRISSTHFATGTGSGQPEGIMVGAGTGVTAAASAALGYADLTGLEHSVDPAYRKQGAKFLFADTTLKLLQDLVDSEGRPLWLPGLANAAPSTILGYAYVVDNGMPAAATGLDAVAFGDLSQYYVRRVRAMQTMRLVERYADFLQVGFLGFVRMDGRVMDASAIKKLTMA